MNIIISIIVNLAAVIYNVACAALNNLSYIIAVRKAEFRIKRNIAAYQDDGFQDYLNSPEVKAWEESFELWHGEVE
jgi:hypothetical protein